MLPFILAAPYGSSSSVANANKLVDYRKPFGGRGSGSSYKNIDNAS